MGDKKNSASGVMQPRGPRPDQTREEGTAGWWWRAGAAQRAALLGGRPEGQGGAWEPCFSPLRLPPPPLPKACISYPYNDSVSGGVWAAYGSRTSVATVFRSQIDGGGTSTRIPLPLEVAEDEPIYVNPKQYHGILRRRQLRAKLEAQNKLVKGRKPYLHESRHLHAMKRARGSGGRFLNTKQQQSLTAPITSIKNGTSSSGSTRLRLGGGATGDLSMLAAKTMASQGKKAVSPAPAFNATPMLRRDDDFFQHPSHYLSFSSHFGQASAQASMHSGTQQRVSAMR
ncbi:hypothetical protein BS78_04G294600 [Paspalum vaginatum]|nr:hypothetical protein BS78_04G294600 [Paspalum vaginatum]